MIRHFGETVIEAYGNTYTLNLRAVNSVQSYGLFAIGAAILTILLVARHFRLRSALYTLGWSGFVLFWYWVYLKLGDLPVYAHTYEGYIYCLYWPELRHILVLMGASTFLCAGAGAALCLARPAALRELPWEDQLAKLWPRAVYSLGLLCAWTMSLSGIDLAAQLRTLSFVPTLEFPAHPRVQVGYPFQARPRVRLVGTVEHHFFGKPTPKYLDSKELSVWQFPSAPFTAAQTGDNQFKYRITRQLPLQFSVERTFHIEAAEERGSPLMPLAVGNTWRYRTAASVDAEQTLVQAFQQNVEPRSIDELKEQVNVRGKERGKGQGRGQDKSQDKSQSKGPSAAQSETPSDSQSVVLRVDGASIENGVRSFTLSVAYSAAKKEDERHETYKLTMWDGETRVEHGKKSVPLLARTSDPAPSGETLYPCRLAVLPEETGCLCTDHPLDARRRLPGLARCVGPVVTTHNTQNLLTLGFGLLTLGLSSAGNSPLQFRGSETHYVGLLLTDSGVN